MRPFLWALAALVPAWACEVPTEIADVADPRAEIEREVSSTSIPSVSAIVVNAESVVWRGSYGSADAGRPADEHTFYDVASVSKLVVVTAVMQLVEQGLLDLETDVNDYLPFPVAHPAHPGVPVTVRHLLTHTSGLSWPNTDADVPGYYTAYPLDGSPPLGAWLPEFIVPEGAHYAPGVWRSSAPGEQEHYSNIGVSLLAHLVEVVAQTDFNTYARERIFAPLQMSSTSFAYADLDMAHAARPYGSGGWAPFTRGRGYPSGDLKTTPEDFSHLLMAYLREGEYQGRRILQPSTVRRILSVENPASGLCLIWAFTLGGWYGHSGGKDGVAAYAEIQPERGVALMIVANQRHSAVYPGHRIHSLVRRIAWEEG
jgi:CubicO group peptidase (beta-lactamase class C family)